MYACTVLPPVRDYSYLALVSVTCNRPAIIELLLSNGATMRTRVAAFVRGLKSPFATARSISQYRGNGSPARANRKDRDT